MRGSATVGVGVGKREASRLRLNIRGRVTSERGTQIVELLDLSETGVRLELSASYRLTEVQLDWLNFQARAIVIWQDRRLCGMRFEEPLALEWVTSTRPAG
jgi:hypothetical protein